MRNRFPVIFWFLECLLTAGPAVPAQVAPAQTAQAILERVQSRYRQIRSLSADFRQIYRGHNIDEEQSGLLLLKKPGRMYWEYQHPEPKYFVADGDKAYFHVPADRQVMVSRMRLDDGSTPLSFLFGKLDAARDFQVRLETGGIPPWRHGDLQLRLIPRQPRAEWIDVLIEISPKSYLIQRLVVSEPVGTVNEYRLSNIRENPKIPNRRFRFKIPPGTEIIRQ